MYLVTKIKRLTPILKWAGGKENELKHILPHIPINMERYIDPFVGGGAVYFAMDSQEMCINDKSVELMNLYRMIKEKNREFFSHLWDIRRDWIALEKIIENRLDWLAAVYENYSAGRYYDAKVNDKITEFILDIVDDFNGQLTTSFNIATENFIKEIKKNFMNKTKRMKKLEHEKGKLLEKDIKDNLECALKSAFYMHFRYLYNNIEEYQINEGFATAIFYFIREYCYASMFRYNAEGKFNVPYGGISYNRKDFSKKIRYLESEEIYKHLDMTNLQNVDFEQFLTEVKPCSKDFIFIDPPYDSDFSTYVNNAFNKSDQVRLANYLINQCPAKFMVVIKNTDFIYNLYSNQGLNLSLFDKKYLVSFQDRNDKNVKHLLIKNY